MHAIREARALAHEEGASPKEVAPPTRVAIWNPDRGEEIPPQQCRQCARVDRIRLGTRLLDARDVKGVGAANGVIVLRELGGQPLPGQRRFEPDRHRARHCAEPRVHGADCLYAPGIRDTKDIAAVVNAVAPKPVNVLVGSNFTTVDQLAQLGVRRISVGGALARVAWAGFLSAAREISEHGTFDALAGAIPFDEINGLFERRAVPRPPPV